MMNELFNIFLVEINKNQILIRNISLQSSPRRLLLHTSIKNSVTFDFCNLQCIERVVLTYLSKSNKNVSMLNMFTFYVFSVFHSFSKTVMGVTWFKFWPLTQEYSFLQKMLKNTKYIS